VTAANTRIIAGEARNLFAGGEIFHFELLEMSVLS
jgi:hypothetical protein